MKPGAEPSAEDTARWDDLTAEFLTKPGVTLERAFSRISLMVGGKLFASASHGGLLIKVSAERVAELIANGRGQPFSTGGNRVMREWVVAAPATDWRGLAAESMAFVAATDTASHKN